MSNLQLVKGVYEAFGRGDVPGVLDAFDPQIKWLEAQDNPYQPSDDAWIGGDAIVQNLFVPLSQEWDGFTVTPTDFYDAGDSIAVEGRYTGTFKGTGKSIDAKFCHVWKTRDDKITSFEQYTSTARFQDTMGRR